jgi:hypothetical protein
MVCPQSLQCQALWHLALELRQDWTCNCTVMTSVDKIQCSKISVALTNINHIPNIYT